MDAKPLPRAARFWPQRLVTAIAALSIVTAGLLSSSGVTGAATGAAGTQVLSGRLASGTSATLPTGSALPALAKGRDKELPAPTVSIRSSDPWALSVSSTSVAGVMHNVAGSGESLFEALRFAISDRIGTGDHYRANVVFEAVTTF